MKYEVIADSSQIKHHLTAQIEDSFLGYLHGFMVKTKTVHLVPQAPVEATGLVVAKIQIKEGLSTYNYLVHIKTTKDNAQKIEGMIEDTDFFIEGVIDTRYATPIIKVVIRERK
jgi:hypothetical protein